MASSLSYSSVVPFSCIPEHFMTPLILEDAGEYTIDNTQFPGLNDEEHRLQPALILAQPEKVTSLPQPQHTSPTLPHCSPLTNGLPNTGYRMQQQQHQHLLNPAWSSRTPTYHSGSSTPTYHSGSSPDIRGYTSNVLSKRQNLGCETLHEAREDLISILSGIQHKEFAKLANPFEAMPALLSAVSFDCISGPAHIPNSCQSRTRLSRQQAIQRKMASHVTRLKKPFQHRTQVLDTQSLENVQQILHHGNSRKRTYQVEDLDDILQCDYSTNKKRKLIEQTQCYSFQKENISVNPMVQFGGHMGIVGY